MPTRIMMLGKLSVTEFQCAEGMTDPVSSAMCSTIKNKKEKKGEGKDIQYIYRT